LNPKPVEDEPLFLDDMSDFDMEEILQESQKPTETTTDGEMTKEISTRESSKPAERDEFEVEMAVLNDIDGLY
jgi:hypothetical protein